MRRQNKLTALPEGFPGSKQSRLTLLHVSSNSLSKLPPSLSECQSLTTLYANGNKITTIPEGISGLSNLVNCNLSNNEISDIPKDFLERFGDPDIDTGKCSKVSLFYRRS
jgi:Leucine-rich repeat (LRR) protein